MEVTWAAAAEADLREIHAYIAADNPSAARAVADAIIEAANGMAAFPMKGHLGEAGTREWPVPRYQQYLLVYDVNFAARMLTILRVWHQARRR